MNGLKVLVMELENDKTPCDCGGWANPNKFVIEGFTVRGWLCTKCKREYYSGDIEKVLVYNKLKKMGIKVKIGIINKGPYVRLPKEVFSIIHKGDTATIRAKSKDEFLIKITHND